MMVPLEPLLALAGALIILLREQGLRYVLAGYLLWVAFEGLWPIVKGRLGDMGIG